MFSTTGDAGGPPATGPHWDPPALRGLCAVTFTNASHPFRLPQPCCRSRAGSTGQREDDRCRPRVSEGGHRRGLRPLPRPSRRTRPGVPGPLSGARSGFQPGEERDVSCRFSQHAPREAVGRAATRLPRSLPPARGEAALPLPAGGTGPSTVLVPGASRSPADSPRPFHQPPVRPTCASVTLLRKGHCGLHFLCLN